MDASLSQNHHPSLKKNSPYPKNSFQMTTLMHVYHKISILLPKYSSPYTQVYNSDESTSDFHTNPVTRKYPNPFHKFSLLVPNKPLMKDMQKKTILINSSKSITNKWYLDNFHRSQNKKFLHILLRDGRLITKLNKAYDSGTVWSSLDHVVQTYWLTEHTLNLTQTTNLHYFYKDEDVTKTSIP